MLAVVGGLQAEQKGLTGEVEAGPLGCRLGCQVLKDDSACGCTEQTAQQQQCLL